MEKQILSTIKHNDHKKWMSTLNLFSDEVRFFQKELLLIVANKTNISSIYPTIEEYKNLFRNKLDKINEFQHRILMSERDLAMGTEEIKKVHQDMADGMKNLTKGFNELKKNFRRFAAHNQ